MQYLTPHKIRGILKTPSRGTPSQKTTPIRPQHGIFSFTEIGELPESSIKRASFGSKGRDSHGSSLADLDKAMNFTPTPRSSSSKKVVKITIQKSSNNSSAVGSLAYLDNEEGSDVKDCKEMATTGNVSTMPSLNAIPSDQCLTTNEDEEENLTERAMTETEEEEKKPVPVQVPSMSMKRIKSKAKSLLIESKDLKQNFERMSELTARTERNYEKSLENLEGRLKHPKGKFDFWKKDQIFKKERDLVQNQVDQFRLQVKESRRELEKLKALDQYLQSEDWGEHEERENGKFNKIEKTLLKEARPFRIKRMFGRSIQIESRSKPDNTSKVDFAYIDSLIGRRETEIEDESEESKPRSTINPKHLEKFNEIEYVFSQMKGEWKENPVKPQEIKEIYDQLDTLDSGQQQEEICSNKVYYFTGIKTLRGHSKGLKKDQVERKCTPGAVEPKQRPYNFKESYTAFRKSNLSRRNQKEI